MGHSVEYVSYNCVTFSYSQGRSGVLVPLFFQKGSNGGGANVSSQYHREFNG